MFQLSENWLFLPISFPIIFHFEFRLKVTINQSFPSTVTPPSKSINVCQINEKGDFRRISHFYPNLRFPDCIIHTNSRPPVCMTLWEGGKYSSILYSTVLSRPMKRAKPRTVFHLYFKHIDISKIFFYICIKCIFFWGVMRAQHLITWLEMEHVSFHS